MLKTVFLFLFMIFFSFFPVSAVSIDGEYLTGSECAFLVKYPWKPVRITFDAGDETGLRPYLSLPWLPPRSTNPSVLKIVSKDIDQGGTQKKAGGGIKLKGENFGLENFLCQTPYLEISPLFESASSIKEIVLLSEGCLTLTGKFSFSKGYLDITGDKEYTILIVKKEEI